MYQSKKISGKYNILVGALLLMPNPAELPEKSRQLQFFS
jgi:hypothetical protein